MIAFLVLVLVRVWVQILTSCQPMQRRLLCAALMVTARCRVPPCGILKKDAPSIQTYDRIVPYPKGYNNGGKGKKRAKKPQKRAGLVLVVIRLGKSDELLDSKPCHHCIQMIKAAKVKKVMYSTGDPQNPYNIESSETITNRASRCVRMLSNDEYKNHHTKTKK